MTAPIVHIGYHKTGTSWFQKSFYPAVRGAEWVCETAIEMWEGGMPVAPGAASRTRRTSALL